MPPESEGQLRDLKRLDKQFPNAPHSGLSGLNSERQPMADPATSSGRTGRGFPGSIGVLCLGGAIAGGL